jgi:hypothetical protein
MRDDLDWLDASVIKLIAAHNACDNSTGPSKTDLAAWVRREKAIAKVANAFFDCGKASLSDWAGGKAVAACPGLRVSGAMRGGREPLDPGGP